MRKIHERIYVGSERDCRTSLPDLAVVHACKIPCHQRVLGYKGSLPTTHPNYLVLEQGNDLYLNIIDPPVPLFKPELFSSFLGFAHRSWSSGTRLVIHCNQATSRAPTLALLFMAKDLRLISDDSFESARDDFANLYPPYRPGLGIQCYLAEHWAEIAC